MPKCRIVALEVFNFNGSNFYCPDCFSNHPDSKDWIKKAHTQKDLIEKSYIFCCKCQKDLSGKPKWTKLIERPTGRERSANNSSKI